MWDLDADTTIFVFYDSENNDTVERVALGQKEGIGLGHIKRPIRGLIAITAHKR